MFIEKKYYFNFNITLSFNTILSSIQLEFFIPNICYVNITPCGHQMFHDEIPVTIISLVCSHQLDRGIIFMGEKLLLEKPFLKHVHFTNGIQRRWVRTSVVGQPLGQCCGHQPLQGSALGPLSCLLHPWWWNMQSHRSTGQLCPHATKLPLSQSAHKWQMMCQQENTPC